MKASFLSTLQASASQMLKGAAAAAAASTSAPAGSGAAAAAAPAHEPGAGGSSGASSEKQYLRLPIDSARKLRWFDKGDLQAIVKSHLQEKRELNEALSALRKALIRAGGEEALESDLELSHFAARADDIAESDRAVAEVLLVPLQDELQALRDERDRLRDEVEQLRGGGGAVAIAAGAQPQPASGGAAASASVSGIGAAGPPVAPQPALDPKLVSGLQRALHALEACMGAASTLQRQMRSTETDLAVAQATAAMLQVVNQSGAAPHTHTSVAAEASGWGDAWDADDESGWDDGPGAVAGERASGPGARAGAGAGAGGRMGTEAEAGDRSSCEGARRSGTGVADGLGGAGAASSSESEAGGAVGHALGDGNGTAAAAGAGAGAGAGAVVGAGAGTGAGAGAQIALAAQLQRAEAERRRLEEEVSELAAALQDARAAADEGAQAALQAREAEERCLTLTATMEKLQAELASARTGLRAAEDALDRRTAELKKAQAAAAGAGSEEAAHMLRKYQDICLSTEERAAAMERRAALAEARCSKLEAAARDSQAATKALQKQLAEAHQEAANAKAAAVAAEAAAGAAKAAAAAQQSSDEVARVRERLEQLEQQLAEQARELMSSQSALATAHQRLAAADVREAQLMAELRELDLVAGEREQLSVQVSALREKLSEQRAEKGQVEHYRQVVRELESGRDRLQEELMVTAQLVTQLEAKLREALRKCDQAETEAQVAEGRAQQAEASIGREVELRLTAACSNRALWPLPIREEVERIEQRLGSLQSSLVAAQAQIEADSERLKQHVDATEAALRRAGAAEARCEDLGVELEAARNALDARVVQLESLDDQVADLRREKSDLTRQLSAAQAVFMRQSSGSGGGGGGGPGGSGLGHPGETHPKWQVQNRVGGGTLYGVADERQAAVTGVTGPGAAVTGVTGAGAGAGASLGRRSSLASSSSSSIPEFGVLSNLNSNSNPNQVGATSAGRPKMEGVDIVYLKNVLLKFMEAAMTGKVAEREVLLPAVAALLQASPAEFQVLKRLVVNTAPSSVQMLSALGLKLS